MTKRLIATLHKIGIRQAKNGTRHRLSRGIVNKRRILSLPAAAGVRFCLLPAQPADFPLPRLSRH
jgi:hypothetical protein